MTETQADIPQPAMPEGPVEPSPWQGLFKVIIRYIYPGLLLGAGTGFWVANSNRVLSEETPVLSAAAGADVGLLALTLAAMAFVLPLLEGVFRDLVEIYSTWRFFAPFIVLALVSAVAAIVSFAGALDNGTGPPRAQDVLFGAAAWLTVWAIAGAFGLVWTLVRYADERAKLRRTANKYPPAGSNTTT